MAVVAVSMHDVGFLAVFRCDLVDGDSCCFEGGRGTMQRRTLLAQTASRTSFGRVADPPMRMWSYQRCEPQRTQMLFRFTCACSSATLWKPELSGIYMRASVRVIRRHLRA